MVRRHLPHGPGFSLPSDPPGSTFSKLSVDLVFVRHFLLVLRHLPTGRGLASSWSSRSRFFLSFPSGLSPLFRRAGFLLPSGPRDLTYSSLPYGPCVRASLPCGPSPPPPVPGFRFLLVFEVLLFSLIVCSPCVRASLPSGPPSHPPELKSRLPLSGNAGSRVPVLY